jgi:hypothetical protein
MVRSAAVVSVPITQRLFNFFACPVCMLGHVLFFGWRWKSRVTIGAETDGLSNATPEHAAARTGEFVLSLDGWGRAEQQLFSWSAWSGLIMNVAVAEYSMRVYRERARTYSTAGRTGDATVPQGQ